MSHLLYISVHQMGGWVDARTSSNAMLKREIATFNGNGFTGHPGYSCGTVKYISNSTEMDQPTAV